MFSLGLVHKDEKKAQDNLAKNVRYMTRALKASDTERDLRKQVSGSDIVGGKQSVIVSDHDLQIFRHLNIETKCK